MSEFDSRLQLMGITVWRLREACEAHEIVQPPKMPDISNMPETNKIQKTQLTSSLFCYALHNNAGKAVGVVLADYVEDVALSRDAQAEWLVKMISALTPHYATCTFDAIPVSSAFCIVLGDAAQTFFSQHPFSSDHVVRQASPRDLYSNQESKKILWSLIKPFRTVF